MNYGKKYSLVVLDDVTLRRGDEALFAHTNWCLSRGQHWAIIGPTGSGKSTLAQVLSRRIPLASGKISYFFDSDPSGRGRPYVQRGEILTVSPESYRRFILRYSDYYQARWQSFEGTRGESVRDVLSAANIENRSPYQVDPPDTCESVYAERRQWATKLLGIDHLLDRGILYLSNGEGKKVLIARALMQSPHLLVLDDPFSSLDQRSRVSLQRALEALLATDAGPMLVLVCPRMDEIPRGITDLAVVENGRLCRTVRYEGQRSNFLAAGRTLTTTEGMARAVTETKVGRCQGAGVRRQGAEGRGQVSGGRGQRAGGRCQEAGICAENEFLADNSMENRENDFPGTEGAWHLRERDSVEIEFPASLREDMLPDTVREDIPLIAVNNATVSYGQVSVLTSVTWTVRRGENWAVVGPNGAGKTTLLSIVLGDNPQCYSNDVRILGSRPGRDRSLRDIRKAMGFVSPDLQAHYADGIPCEQVVLSGFSDTIGLQRSCSAPEIEYAAAWMQSLGISSLAETCFGSVSVGQQRLVLLARAMVRDPYLLILDEPCQSLSADSRRAVLHVLDRLCTYRSTSLICVSHHADEIPSKVTHVLHLSGGCVERIEERSE